MTGLPDRAAAIGSDIAKPGAISRGADRAAEEPGTAWIEDVPGDLLLAGSPEAEWIRRGEDAEAETVVADAVIKVRKAFFRYLRRPDAAAPVEVKVVASLQADSGVLDGARGVVSNAGTGVTRR
jgi:hypothetical protein